MESLFREFIQLNTCKDVGDREHETVSDVDHYGHWDFNSATEQTVALMQGGHMGQHDVDLA